MRPTPAQLELACDDLARRDPVLRRAYRDVRIPQWRHAEADFATLARAVVHQLLSVQAAETIWRRVTDHFDGNVETQSVLRVDVESLRGCGLSRPKIAHLQSIAQAIEGGALSFERLAQAPYPAAHRELVSVKGIGPWTADLFLMTALGHVDAFPGADVGLQEAYRQIAGQEDRPPTAAFIELAESWRPYRGVAAHLLWAWLNRQRDLSGR